MAAELLTDASRALDANANALEGATWTFYATGTTTPQAVYTSAALTTPHTNPVVADAGGKFAPIYFDATKIYRGVMRTAVGITVYDIDPINSTIMSDLAEDGGAASIGTSDGATVEDRLNWLPRTNIPMNGGDVAFTTSDTYGNTNDGSSGGTIYIGRKWTGAITPGPAARDRGYGGAANHWDVRYDDADIGTDFGRIGMFRDVITGSAAKGGRIGVVGEINQQSVTNAANLNRNYVGLQGNAISHTGDGGTDLTTGAKGSYFGGGMSAYLYAAATNVLTVCGVEINTFTETGSSTKFLVGLSVASANASRGDVVDAAIDIGGQNDADSGINHIGWKHGIIFSDHHGADPTYSGSILMGSHWESGGARTVLHGIDLSGFAVTGALIQGQRAVVTEDTLTLGANGSEFSNITAGNGSTNAHLALISKGTGGVRLRDGGGSERVIVDTGQGVTLVPLASSTPAANGQLVVQATSNTSLTFKLKGSDGTVRSGSLVLA